MPDDLTPSVRAQLAGAAEQPDLLAYEPGPQQARAKARLHAELAKRTETMRLDSCTAEEWVEFSGTRRILQWLKDPAFVAWVSDKDAYVYQAMALRETCVLILADILTSDYEPRILTAKDKLKAADMLLNLTGAYPAKQREIRYLDKDLDTMAPDEVQRQLAEARKVLATLPES